MVTFSIDLHGHLTLDDLNDLGAKLLYTSKKAYPVYRMVPLSMKLTLLLTRISIHGIFEAVYLKKWRVLGTKLL